MTNKPSMDVFEDRKLTRYPYFAVVLGVIATRVLSLLPSKLLQLIQRRTEVNGNAAHKGNN